MGEKAFLLRPFEPDDQMACKELILAGLKEHWRFLDYSLNPDLNDITASYAGGLFLTAWRDAQLAGTGALLPAEQDCLQVVRMSVQRRWRRQGLGQLVLRSLEAAAQKMGAKRLILETTSAWSGVIQFYLDSGYQITHARGGDAYFEKRLAVNAGQKHNQAGV